MHPGREPGRIVRRRIYGTTPVNAGESTTQKLVILVLALAAIPAYSQSTAGFSFRAQLTGYQEVPSVATNGRGTLELELSGDFQSLEYVLTFSGLQGTVQQAHIHFAQPGVNGAIVVWMCGTTAQPGPAGTPTCPQAGTVRGVISAAHVLATPTTQQVSAGELGKFIQALRASAAYANVHASISPGGEIRGQIF